MSGKSYQGSEGYSRGIAGKKRKYEKKYKNNEFEKDSRTLSVQNCCGFVLKLCVAGIVITGNNERSAGRMSFEHLKNLWASWDVLRSHIIKIENSVTKRWAEIGPSPRFYEEIKVLNQFPKRPAILLDSDRALFAFFYAQIEEGNKLVGLSWNFKSMSYRRDDMGYLFPVSFADSGVKCYSFPGKMLFHVMGKIDLIKAIIMEESYKHTKTAQGNGDVRCRCPLCKSLRPLRSQHYAQTIDCDRKNFTDAEMGAYVSGLCRVEKEWSFSGELPREITFSLLTPPKKYEREERQEGGGVRRDYPRQDGHYHSSSFSSSFPPPSSSSTSLVTETEMSAREFEQMVSFCV